MGKEIVTLEEKKALEEYKYGRNSLEYALKYYIQNNSCWTNQFAPLREMGFEKFVKCMVNGYEIEFNDSLDYTIKCTDGETINISYNYSKKYLKGKNDPIYFKYNSLDSTGLTIENTKKLIEGLQSLLQQLELLNNNEND